MASIKQISANRKNAARSRGPSTTAGKSRSSGNALRHGLTVKLLNDSSGRAEAERLALAVAGSDANQSRLSYAWTVAEARLDLFRIRDAQVRLLDSAYVVPTVPEGGGQGGLSREALIEALPQLVRLHDYERKILSRLKRGMRALSYELCPA